MGSMILKEMRTREALGMDRPVGGSDLPGNDPVQFTASGAALSLFFQYPEVG
jgi:hypothetical protein